MTSCSTHARSNAEVHAGDAEREGVSRSGHPNDTLQGKLHHFEREDEKHLRRKLGYWRMVEERAIRERLIGEGHNPSALDFLNKIAVAVRENHANDETFSVQSARISRAWAKAHPSKTEGTNRAAIEALHQIANGHNDAMNLARQVLAMLEPSPTPPPYQGGR